MNQATAESPLNILSDFEITENGDAFHPRCISIHSLSCCLLACHRAGQDNGKLVQNYLIN